ncbi:MAG: SDR family oxidoreductase [Nanoarchaeota archaeon]|nr:SDR family oxidoreductase [Nanoarchaeota archaeon]MBU1321857.1 SDR family oxidoreductase [Nanoarchaeota archaeon]MBU1597202.1 SDR family oxidoreductase [Nanoarchaeota archaeon]MBU2441901.1 SDR family oxidoreductase [Nanoarchaeota archaeon]
MRFKEKVVLVTGSSRGIGTAIALLFAKEGAKVVINYYKSEKEANEVMNEIKKISDAITIKCDVSNEEQVKNMIKKIIKKFGKLDILVNNAGNYIEGDEWSGSSNIWAKTIKQNLISAMNTSKYAAEIFQKQKSGVIVNIASRYSVSGQFDALAYAASKAGIVNITQAYAKLLAPYGRANAVSPWPVKSGYWLRAPKEELEETISKMPGKRLIEPEEIAEVVLSLASPESAKITGQNILVDGGKNNPDK